MKRIVDFVMVVLHYPQFNTGITLGSLLTRKSLTGKEKWVRSMEIEGPETRPAALLVLHAMTRLLFSEMGLVRSGLRQRSGAGSLT